ncbi:MAG: MerR family transcriptional regulator [Rhodospirillaceae bacterium]|jgi:MerR family transcriptional regulator, mercuric resistance operon regulatory protein
MTETAILIGELSQKTGCNIETIRYYERIGVLPKARRRGRYRTYRGEDIERLYFVRRARDLGFTLEDVRRLLKLGAEGSSCKSARDIAASHLEDIRKRIFDLTKMETVLSTAVRACDQGRHRPCPILETLADKPIGGTPLAG